MNRVSRSIHLLDMGLETMGYLSFHRPDPYDIYQYRERKAREIQIRYHIRLA